MGALNTLPKAAVLICCGVACSGIGDGASTRAEVDPTKLEEDTPTIRIETSVVIEVPIEEVFEFVTAPENDALWLEGVVRAEKTSEGPVSVGATSISEIHFLGMRSETGWEVIEYERPGHIRVRSTSGPIPIEASHSFETTAEGATEVTLFGVAEIGGFFMLGEPIVGPMVQGQWEASYRNLKGVLEARE